MCCMCNIRAIESFAETKKSGNEKKSRENKCSLSAHEPFWLTASLIKIGGADRDWHPAMVDLDFAVPAQAAAAR